jgi:DNA-binding transcriptional LysR family regulator
LGARNFRKRVSQELEAWDLAGQSRADWTALKTFGAVVEHGGFGAAARALNVSPSTVTRHIDELETRLDAKLLLRGAQGVSLTEAGHAIFDHVRTMGRSAEALEREVLRRDSRLEGEVRLAMPDGLAAFVVAPAMQEFLRGNPKIHLLMDCGFWPGHPLNSEVDLCLTYTEPTHPDVIARPIAHSHYALYAATSYLELYGRPETLEAAATHRYVHHVALKHQPEQWAAKLGPFFGMANPSATTNCSAVSFLAIQNGVGIGLLPTFVSAHSPNLEILQERPLSSPKLWLYHHRDLATSARVKLVVGWLDELFDPKTNPWFRPEFVHPRDFAGAAEPPLAVSRPQGRARA